MERSQYEDKLEFGEKEILSLAGPLKRLLDSEPWDVYREMLKLSRIRAKDIALEDEESQLKFWRGYVAGLLAAEEVPRSILRDYAKIVIKDEATKKVDPKQTRRVLEDEGDASF